MSSSPSFDRAYRALNAEQKLAVDTIDGPVMVVAGPGTGKTQMLTLRIAHILLTTDTRPEQVLALTFTESGVRAMRERLREHIGALAYRVHIHTFHSFANSLITLYPDMFPRIIGSQPLQDVERTQILETCILEETLEVLRPYGDPLFYLNDIGRAITDCKREAVTPELLAERVQAEEDAFAARTDSVHTKGAHKGKMKGEFITLQKKLARNKELVAVYYRYEQEMRARKRYDFDDMIIEVVRALREDALFQQEVAERFLYIHADEHQDANGGQNAILELLTLHVERPNVFVVGDEKQSIFRFQGATLDNFLHFQKVFPEAVLIPLLRNYRSTQPILDAAQSLIDHAPGDETLRIPLTAEFAQKASRPITYAVLVSETDEEWYVASEIAKLFEKGVSPKDIAIIYRDNKEASSLHAALNKKGIPNHITSDANALRNPYVQSLIALMRAAASVGDDQALPEVLHVSSLQLPILDVFALLQGTARMRVPLWRVLAEPRLLRECQVQEVGVFSQLFDTMLSWQRHAKTEALPAFAERVFRESRLLDEVLATPDCMEHLAHVRGFLRALGALLERNHRATLTDVIEWLDRHERHAIPIRPEGRVDAEGAVSLMTAHRSKGLEFRYVFIVGVIDGRWGDRNRAAYFHVPGVIGTSHDLDDERRLLYVALTRAKEHVTVSYATSVSGKDVSRSALLDEIDERLVEVVQIAPTEEREELRSRFNEVRGDTEHHQLKVLVRTAFLQHGLSVTALNNYLACPWKYFYVNLLRIPQAKEKPMLFGSAVHDALRYYFDAYRREKDVSIENTIAYFESVLLHLPLVEREIEELRTKGGKALYGYLQRYEGTWIRHTYPEHALSAQLPIEIVGEAELPLLLRGTLDRMDVLDSGFCVVTDYKTGKPKSRNEIEGKTKHGTGDYKRQLVFYALLLSRSDEKRRMESGVLDFVEPDQKGIYHREAFSIPDEDIIALEQEVKRVAGEILTLAFWNARCDDKDCEYCALRRKVAQGSSLTKY